MAPVAGETVAEGAACREIALVEQVRCVDRGRPSVPVERHQRVNKGVTGRSEEHTSELQSLMRISYAVFCLKKTTVKDNIQTEKRSQIQITTNIIYTQFRYNNHLINRLIKSH